MSKRLFRFTEKEDGEQYRAELNTLPEFGDVQINCTANLDYSYMVEKIETDPNFKHKMKEIAITDMVNDFFERVIKESGNERFKIADKYLDDCDQLFCQGAVYSDSGFYYKDTQKAIKIASGLEQP